MDMCHYRLGRWISARQNRFDLSHQFSLAAKGANLTQSQYLTPVTVRAAAERFGWWDHDRAPRSESEVHQLLHLREAATRLRLTRRTGRTLKLTKLGASSLADPVSLWRLVVPSLRGGDEFEAMMRQTVFVSATPADYEAAHQEKRGSGTRRFTDR